MRENVVDVIQISIPERERWVEVGYKRGQPRATGVTQLCHGFKSIVDMPFFPPAYGVPRSHASRNGGCAVIGEDENVIEPSAPPKDSAGPLPGANELSGGADNVFARIPLLAEELVANGFAASTSAERSDPKPPPPSLKLLPNVGVGSGSQLGPSLALSGSALGREEVAEEDEESDEPGGV